MTTNITKHKAPAIKKEKTEAGNYFVANYPPFSFWTPEKIGEFEAALEQKPVPGNPLGLYLHIPFCRKRCHFCYFKVYTDRNSKEIRGYTSGLIDELRLYIDKPFIGGRKPKYVYFGGGTPSYLSTEQLRGLIGGLTALLPWDEAEEITFECEPGTLTEKKLDVLRELGVTRLSLGVENFSDEILSSNGRAHLSAEIDRAYSYARELEFPQINIDLIAGMMNETDENWRECVARALALEPDCVTIYQMEIPYNTTIFQQMKSAGKVTAPVADWPQKREWVAYAFDRFEAAGYSVTSAYTVVKNPAQYKFLYRDYLWRGADMISLGVASFGHVNGAHYQNEKDLEPYMQRIAAGERPVHRAHLMDREEQLIRELVLQFKTGSVSLAYFQEKFGVDLQQRFSAQLSRQQDGDYLTADSRGIRLARAGLLIVDWLLQEYFLPRHKDSRYT